ncbi:SURF1 family protein [Litorivita sp. NS0012-18]|uniref:SURF1 family protein n=1 Tax=Litorivita sp. NS0012-18 TaxID=3127655 RepID=UPI00310AD60F
MRRIIIPLIFGLAGAAILISLGTWQVRRLAWKEAVLADIEARISAAPVAIPAVPDPEADRYLPVAVRGTYGEGRIRVLSSRQLYGAGYRIIAPFETGGRLILIDRGFVQERDAIPAAPQGEVTLRGNLHWPSETDKYTPDPNLEADIWFARDVPAMAAHLGTDPVLMVLRGGAGEGAKITPLPIDTSGIPNNHMQYAFTWFSLAFIWLVMTGYFIWRIRNPLKGT